MASKVSGTVEYVNVASTDHAIASTAYGYCTVAADNATKIVDMDGFKLNEGVTIHVKFQYGNTAANPTLNVQSTGDKPIIFNDDESSGGNTETTGWHAGAVLTLTYDGTSWVRDQGYNTNQKVGIIDLTGG